MVGTALEDVMKRPLTSGSTAVPGSLVELVPDPFGWSCQHPKTPRAPGRAGASRGVAWGLR